MTVIDSDQHLFEHRGLWEEHVDPALRDQALRFVDDPLGHVHLVWRDRVLSVADRREREGLPPAARYDEILPRDYWDPAARGEAPRDRRGRGDALPQIRPRLGAPPRRGPLRARPSSAS